MGQNQDTRRMERLPQPGRGWSRYERVAFASSSRKAASSETVRQEKENINRRTLGIRDVWNVCG